MTTTQIAVPELEQLFALLERHSREVHDYVSKPIDQFSPEALLRQLAKMYACAERLKEIADEARAAEAAKSNGSTAEQAN